MIGLLLSLALNAYAYATPPAEPPQHHRPEVCPGAVYFYEKHHKKPYWYKDMQVACVIGNHVFMREKPKRRHRR